MSELYQNIYIKNDTNTYQQAVFDEIRTIPILRKANEYDVSVIRFRLPANNIPIFNFADRTFTCAILYSGQYYIRMVEYRPYTSVNFPAIPNKPVYAYQDFLNMLNLTFKQICLDINTAAGSTVIPTGAYPFLEFVEVTNLMRLVMNSSLFTGATPTLKVFMNTKLNYFFESLPDDKIVILDLPTSPAVSLVEAAPSFIGNGLPSATQEYFYSYMNPRGSDAAEFKSTGWENNATAYDAIAITEEYPCLFQWNSAAGIVITTESIPIAGDIYSTPATSTGSSVGAPLTQKVLTDFNLQSDLGTEARSIISYIPFGEYRLIPLISDSEMRRTDLKVFWIDTSGNLFPLILNPRGTMNIKLMYRKKTAPKGF